MIDSDKKKDIASPRDFERFIEANWPCEKLKTFLEENEPDNFYDVPLDEDQEWHGKVHADCYKELGRVTWRAKIVKGNIAAYWVTVRKQEKVWHLQGDMLSFTLPD